MSARPADEAAARQQLRHAVDSLARRLDDALRAESERAEGRGEEPCFDRREARMATALLASMRLLSGTDLEVIHRVFGAPGDWGYDSAIGSALAALYASGQR